MLCTLRLPSNKKENNFKICIGWQFRDKWQQLRNLKNSLLILDNGVYAIVIIESIMYTFAE